MAVTQARQIFLLSSSNLHGFPMLGFAKEDIESVLKSKNVTTLLFIPYALNNYDEYLETFRKVFNKWGYEVEGIHNSDPAEAAKKAQAFFVGGGNTFRLLKALCDNSLIEIIRRRVLNEGVPYFGSSAGSNVATRSINTTNDMPIVYPPTFDALKLVPFNINPHYQDPDPSSTHKGETREDRIQQYFEIPGSGPVVGLREGSSLYVNGDQLTLKGSNKARLFIPGQPPKEVDGGSDLSFLLKI